jgi:adenosyl cobinamide kinase/adenosyl cobinamide phosphate guanylyltransferase
MNKLSLDEIRKRLAEMNSLKQITRFSTSRNFDNDLFKVREIEEHKHSKRSDWRAIKGK